MKTKEMTKKVKLHHWVKNFYHKNPFRKFYTLMIVWLVLANFCMINIDNPNLVYWYWYWSNSCIYYDRDWNQQIGSIGSTIDLYSSNLVPSGDSCHSYRNTYTCDYDDWIFKIDWNAYSSDLYDYCEEEWRNTATLETNADWDYELTYDGTTYIMRFRMNLSTMNKHTVCISWRSGT